MPTKYDQCGCGKNKVVKAKRCLDCHKKLPKMDNRAMWLMKCYGITPDEFDLLLESQNWKCAICFTTEPSCNKQFQVDHDHSCCPGEKTCGECIRGLLCCDCNQGLGKFHDNVDLLMKAVNYLITRSKI